MLEEIHRSNEDGNGILSASLLCAPLTWPRGQPPLQAIKQRLNRVEPALAQKEAHRLHTGRKSALDNLHAFCDEDALFRLEHAPQLALRKLGVRIETRVVEGGNMDDLVGSHRYPTTWSSAVETTSTATSNQEYLAPLSASLGSTRSYVTNSNATPSSPSPGWMT